jgi:hypothetical protein
MSILFQLLCSLRVYESKTISRHLNSIERFKRKYLLRTLFIKDRIFVIKFWYIYISWSISWYNLRILPSIKSLTIPCRPPPCMLLEINMFHSLSLCVYLFWIDLSFQNEIRLVQLFLNWFVQHHSNINGCNMSKSEFPMDVITKI